MLLIFSREERNSVAIWCKDGAPSPQGCQHCVGGCRYCNYKVKLNPRHSLNLNTSLDNVITSGHDPRLTLFIKSLKTLISLCFYST